MGFRPVLTLMLLLAACGPSSQAITTPTAMISPLETPRADGVKTADFDLPLEGRSAAQLMIDATLETVLISPLLEGDHLLEAEIEYLGEIEFPGDGEIISLVESNPGIIYEGDKPLIWLLRLNPAVTLDLGLRIDSGEIQMDARELHLSNLSLNVRSGSMTLDLPPLVDSLETLQVAGTITLNLPENAESDIKSMQVNSGLLNLNIGADSHVNIAQVTIGSGMLRLDAPDEAALRVEVGSVGAGSINLAFPLTRIDGTDSDEGVWETQGFANAERRILITINEIGSGSFEVE